jgi:hypothetical protein
MAKTIVAIENVGSTAKFVVKDGDSFRSMSIPTGIIQIDPIEVEYDYSDDPNNHNSLLIKPRNDD